MHCSIRAFAKEPALGTVSFVSDWLCQKRKQHTMCEPMRFLPAQSLDCERPRYSLFLVLLHEPFDVFAITSTFFPVGSTGSFCSLRRRNFIVLLAYQGSELGKLVVISDARRGKVICRKLPESEIESRAAIRQSRISGSTEQRTQ